MNTTSHKEKKHYKQYQEASEWKNWLFSYSVPVLNDIIRVSYLWHYTLLVETIFPMLKSRL